MLSSVRLYWWSKATITMEMIIILALLETLAHGKAINNEFSFKYNPVLSKDHADFDAKRLFVKIAQGSSISTKRESLNNAFFPAEINVGKGYTNNLGKMPLAPKFPKENVAQIFTEYIKIPMVHQPSNNYTIIVATTPWNVKISGPEAQPLIIYVVFTEDDEQSNDINIPSIYFVKKHKNGSVDLNTKEKLDPILLVDNNRTVTGLKSKTVPKFVKFRNRRRLVGSTE